MMSHTVLAATFSEVGHRDIGVPKDGEKAKRSTKDISRPDIYAALERVRRKDPGEIGDARVEGFCICIRASSASWSVRARLRQPDGRNPITTRSIEVVSLGDDPATMRLRAMHAKELMKNGMDPANWLAEQAGRPLPAPAKLTPEVAVKTPTEEERWTWPEARENFLEHVKGKKARATYVDYKNVLHGPRMANRWAE